MALIEIKAALRDGEAIVGCSVVVTTTLTSVATGKVLVEVDAPGTESRFEYELQSPTRGLFSINARAYRQASDLMGSPPPVNERKPLVPGESAEYAEDIGAWFLTSPPPGDYTLVVRYELPNGNGLIASDPVPLRIVEARPTRATAIVGLNGQHHVSAFAHDAGPNGTLVVQRDGEYGNPELGRGQVRHRVAAGVTVEGLALATEVDAASGWRWLAWLEGEAFRGAITWGTEVMTLSDPSPHGLAQARLLPAGWQVADGAALFVLVGSRDGRASADIVHIPKGEAPQHNYFEIDGAVPAMAVAGYWQHTRAVIELVRGDVVDGEVRIGAQRLDLSAAPKAGPLQPLFAGRAPLLALAIAPLLSPAPTVDALLGPPASADAGRSVTYHRAPLLGGAVQAWPLVLPTGAATAFDIATVTHPKAPTLVEVGDALWLADAAAGRGFARVVDSSHGIRHARVEHVVVPDGSIVGRVQLTWFDGLFGYCVRSVPEL